MKKRIRYFDLLRVISFACIVYYHMVVQMHFSDYWTIDFVEPYFENANMHIATLAVAIFFMLSGAALMYTSQDDFQIGTFYRKRFKRLLVPFYVTNVLYVAARLVQSGGQIESILPPDVPKWRLIFTLLGLDEWVSMHGVKTFSVGIGEWFLGALLILYVLFPLLRMLVLRKPWITLAAAAVVWLVLLWTDPFPVNPYMNLFFKGFEFLLGMYLGIYWEKVRAGWLFVTVPVMLFFFFSPVRIPVNGTLKITVLAVSCFITFSFFERLPDRFEMRPVRILSGVSYEIFLVHHLVIYAVFAVFPPTSGQPATFARTFALQLVGMTAAGLVVKFISGWILSHGRNRA